MKKIILVDDKEVFRKSLIETLKTAGDVEIIGEASNGEEFLELLKIKKPEIVFMDIEMPIMDGIEATKRALKKYPDLVIIGLSMYDNESYIDKLIKVGAHGYLLKESDNYILFEAIIKHHESEFFFSDDLSYKPNLSRNKIKNILLVDSFGTNLFVMESFLTTAGFNVKASCNAQDALKTIKEFENKFDLFVIDHRMPVMNGIELVEKIRKLDKYEKTPIMVSSFETDKEKKLEAKKAGATGWMKKPLKLYEFLSLIESAF
jgi:DNA-binding NarL/FixJ family response regulator